VSGLLRYFPSASSFLELAKGFSDNTLGALFNLANLPKPQANLGPIVGFQEQSRLAFIENFRTQFLPAWMNTPQALFKFQKGFDSGYRIHNPSPTDPVTPAQFLFARIVSFVHDAGEPFYRVQEVINYLIAQYPQWFSEHYAPELLELVSAYQAQLSQDPDALIERFKSLLQARVEKQPSLFPMLFDDLSDAVELLDGKVERLIESKFPQLEFLLSDEGRFFIEQHLRLLPSDYALRFYQDLLKYVQRLSKDLESSVHYEDKISYVYLETRDRIAGLKEMLQSKIEASKPNAPEKSAPSQRPAGLNTSLTPVAQAVQKVTRHFTQNPMHLFVIGLSFLGTRASAERPKETTRNLQSIPFATPVNISVGSALSYYVGSYYNCGTYLNSTTILACPASASSTTDISTLTPSYPFAKWLSNNGMTLIGTPKITDRFWQGVQRNLQRYTCPSNFNAVYSLCSTMEQLAVRFTFWIQDTPPYPIALANDTQPDPYLEPGIKPIFGDGSSFSGNFLINGPGDLENDTVLFQSSLSNGNRLPVWMTAIPSSGDISVVPPPGNAGKWNIRMRLYNPDWDGKIVVDYSFNTVTWASSRWISSYVQIPAQPIQVNIPINDQVYVATSGQKLIISAATSAIVTVPSATPVNITLRAASNSSLPANIIYKSSRQAIEFSPNPQQVPFGTYDCELVVCDTPSYACSLNTACEPVAPSCVAVPFSAEYQNSAPQLPQLSPASTTIGTAVTLTSIAARSTDADLDPLTFSIRIKPDTGHTMPDGILIDSSTGEVSWLPSKGTAPGTYQFEILADDGHGAESSTTWTVTLNPRPIQIKPGLQSTVASTPMQRAGSATYPFPFRAPDLTDAQLPAFASQVDVQIPEALAPFVSVQLNTSTLSYNVSWTSIPGHGGSSPIIFTYTDPLTGQQTSTQTFLEVTNAGPYKISNPVFVTDLTGMPVDYDLATHFGHLDPDTALHFSADLPVGLELSDEGRISGAPEIPGHYKIAVSVTDDYGRTLSSASLDLTTPYAPPTVLSSHRADISVAINPTSFTPELTGTFQTPSPDGLAQTYSLISGPPCFTVASDGSWAVNPQNGQQGNYTALIQVRNGDQVATFSKPISIPRATIQTLSSPAFSSYIARSFSMDACTLITDPDSPGTCSNFQVSFNPPEALAAYVTSTGTVYNFNPLSGAQVQGTHPLSFRFTDKITGQVFTVPVFLTYQNQAPQAQNGVSQKTVTSTAESVFTTPYMEASDLDGDALNRAITGAPPACLTVDAEKQLSCTNVPAGNYPVVFSFNDGHGGNVSATLLLKISRVTHTPWYINRAQDALPGVAGSFFIFFLPIFLKYRRDRRKTAGLDALYLKLPKVIADIANRQATYLHHPALSHESHPLGVIPLKSSAERSQRRMPTVPAVATAAMATPPAISAGSTSPRTGSPGGLRRRVQALMGAGIGAGAASGAGSSAPTPPALMATPTTPVAPPVAQVVQLALGHSKQASHLSVTLMDKARALTDDLEDIAEFQTDFNLYLKALDQYHEKQGPDPVRNCNLMKLTEAIAERLDDLIDKTSPQITDKITMMVHWLKLLYIRFVFYSSGLSTSPSIKLINKRSLLQGLTELIKAVRPRLANPQLLALYKELEFLRALITSVPDEDRASLWKSMPFPCIRRPDRGTATLPDDALIPKAWFLQVLAIQELSQIARIDLTALAQLNTWIESANGEGTSSWIPFRKSYPRIELAIHEFLALRPLKNAKDRGEVNYWAVDSYLSILDYWNLDSTRVQPSDLDYLKTLTRLASKMFSRTFADQVSEEFIKDIVLGQLQKSLLTLFKKMPAEMAASCLLNLSHEFKQPIVQALLTRYLKESSPTHFSEFYTAIKEHYKNPEKAKHIEAWLRTASDSTPGVMKLRGDIRTWRSVSSGRALAWWGTSRSLPTGAGAGSSAAPMITNPLMMAMNAGAKATARPDPAGGSVTGSSEATARLWRSPGAKNSAASSRAIAGQTPGKVREEKREVGMKA